MRVIVLMTWENKVNSYSDQLKLGWVSKFGVGFDKKLHPAVAGAGSLAELKLRIYYHRWVWLGWQGG